jgi:hypothetical protein
MTLLWMLSLSDGVVDPITQEEEEIDTDIDNGWLLSI